MRHVLVEKQAPDWSGVRYGAWWTSQRDMDWHQLIQQHTYAGQLRRHLLSRVSWGSAGKERRLVASADRAMGWPTAGCGLDRERLRIVAYLLFKRNEK